MKRALVVLSAAILATGAFAAPSAGNTAPRKGPSCCAEEETAGSAQCSPVSETAVTLTGIVLCEHCDLHTAKSCNPVFKADGRDGYLAFWPGTKDVKAVKDAGAGKAKLEVKGKLRRTKDGTELLLVETFAKKP
jgi:hypothetical protein